MKRTNYKDVSSKVRNIAKRTLAKDGLAEQLIVKLGNDYQAFGTHYIKQTETHWEVTHSLSDDVLTFSASKSALGWCIAHKTQHYGLADYIKLLDWRMEVKQRDIDILSHKLEQDIDPTLRSVMQCRLSEDVGKRNEYRRQLAKCLKTAKYIKIKGPLQ